MEISHGYPIEPPSKFSHKSIYPLVMTNIYLLKMAIVVDLPMENDDFPSFLVSLPEGISH